MPDTVALAKGLEARGLSYRRIAAELATQGHVTRTGKPHVASAVQKMLGVSAVSARTLAAAAWVFGDPRAEGIIDAAAQARLRDGGAMLLAPDRVR